MHRAENRSLLEQQQSGCEGFIREYMGLCFGLRRGVEQVPGMNFSRSPTRLALLKSMRRQAPLFALTITLMAASASATAGYAWLVGPALHALHEQGFAEIFLSLGFSAEGQISLSLATIAAMLEMLALVRALSETLRSRWAARAQLDVIRELRAILLAHALALPARLRQRWTHGELASRIQVEVQGMT